MPKIRQLATAISTRRAAQSPHLNVVVAFGIHTQQKNISLTIVLFKAKINVEKDFIHLNNKFIHDYYAVFQYFDFPMSPKTSSVSRDNNNYERNKVVAAVG